MEIKQFCIREGKDFQLSSIRTDDTCGLSRDTKADEAIAKNIRELTRLQDVLYL